jgi:cellulose synthase/poly-beta-1,6-N-acetylglucosamine synthase-like glycosyltransferase
MSALLSISVVIPVFNEEANIEETVRRCVDGCSRTGSAFEIVLVDDGSTGHSREKITRALSPEILLSFYYRNLSGSPSLTFHLRGVSTFTGPFFPSTGAAPRSTGWL